MSFEDFVNNKTEHQKRLEEASSRNREAFKLAEAIFEIDGIETMCSVQEERNDMGIIEAKTHTTPLFDVGKNYKLGLSRILAEDHDYTRVIYKEGYCKFNLLVGTGHGNPSIYAFVENFKSSLPVIHYGYLKGQYTTGIDNEDLDRETIGLFREVYDKCMNTDLKNSKD